MTDFTLHLGDCLETLKTLPDCSVDSVITDPPYGLSQHTPQQVADCLGAWLRGEEYKPNSKGFMGKSWDAWVPSPAVWRECLRVLKPGGHLLAFAGTRSMDLMSMAVRLAGFELRDSIGYAHDGGGAPLLAWAYGSGFPKSLDVSKAIDKVNGEAGRLHKFTAWMRTTGLTGAQINAATGTFMGSHYLTDKSQPAIPTPELWGKLRPLCGDVPAWVDELVDRIAAEREVVGIRDDRGRVSTFGGGESQPTFETAPATEAARQWQGWGTALKPAWEPIILARKPLDGTVAENVLKHGTGAINVDGCRVAGWKPQVTQGINSNASSFNVAKERRISGDSNEGRWPANLIHDGSDSVMDVFPSVKTGVCPAHASGTNTVYGDFSKRKHHRPAMNGGDSGSAARFFYCAKAGKRDRDEGLDGFEKRNNMRVNAPRESEEVKHATKRANTHPTVKPTDLMRYLCRLVTPPNGVVLDPFTGSGSTGKAAILEGFKFIGCEMQPDYYAIAKARIEAACTT